VSHVLPSPLSVAFGLALGGLVALVAASVVFAWQQRRLARRWAREDQLRQQLWAMEDQIWRESLPDSQREAFDRADRQRVAIQREARRRLGLPEEKG
jgi:hypothetical protein